MNVTLDQAIELYAAALVRRARLGAPRLAEERGLRCEAAGDRDGRAVWKKVAEVAQTLIVRGPRLN